MADTLIKAEPIMSRSFNGGESPYTAVQDYFSLLGDCRYETTTFASIAYDDLLFAGQGPTPTELLADQIAKISRPECVGSDEAYTAQCMRYHVVRAVLMGVVMGDAIVTDMIQPVAASGIDAIKASDNSKRLLGHRRSDLRATFRTPPSDVFYDRKREVLQTVPRSPLGTVASRIWPGKE